MECPVCLQDFALPLREPRVLTCGHSFCSECLTQMTTHGGVCCPMCRVMTAAREVHTNFALSEVLSRGAGAAAAAEAASAATSAAVAAPAPAQEPPAEEEVDVGLRVLAATPEEGAAQTDVLVSVLPPEGARRSPCDVCCVVDVSDSMGAEAMAKDGAGATTSHGLEILDIVKHALRTIIRILGEFDRLAIVAYASSACAVLQPLAMDAAGRRTAEARLSLLQLDGMTNLWAGLQLGVELLAESRRPGRLQHVLLLTDGVPTVNPPRGIVPMLEKLKRKMGGSLPCSVSTFGFGSELDSELLVELARIGAGSYAFIPDAGFVGTVFVNAITNLLVTLAASAKLRLRPLAGATIVEALGCTPPRADGDILEVDLVSLQFGQSRDVVLRVQLPPGQGAGAELLEAELHFATRGQGPPRLAAASGKLPAGLAREDAELIEVQRCRALLVDSARQVMKTAKLTKLDQLQGKALPLPEAQAHVSAVAAQIMHSPAASAPAVAALLEDLTGQVAEAVSREDWYTKWGVHYLPSLMGAHLLQQCNNFKDPGVQVYGGELFNELRDEADEVFCQLPPPTRTARPNARAASLLGATTSATTSARGAAVPPVAAPARAAPVSMAAYYDRYSGCLDGESELLLAGGGRIRAAAVRRGDRLAAPGGGEGEVECVVRTRVPEGCLPLVRLTPGLALTLYHPVQAVDGTWCFPTELAEATPQPCSELITFLLREGDSGAVVAGGVPCVALGHGLREGAAAHEYFGSRRVREDLSQFPGFKDGLVDLSPFSTVRDPETGRVCGLRP